MKGKSIKRILFTRDDLPQTELMIEIDNQFLDKYRDAYSPERAELVEAILDSLDSLLKR